MRYWKIFNYIHFCWSANRDLTELNRDSPWPVSVKNSDHKQLILFFIPKKGKQSYVRGFSTNTVPFFLLTVFLPSFYFASD